MSEEKKYKFYKYGFITSTLCCMALIGDKLYTDIGKKTILGTTIKLDKDAIVYSSIEDMIKNTNPQTPYYNTEIDRLVITAFYNVNGEYIRVDMKGDYKTKEQQIIDKNGILIGVITTIDYDKQTPEAFYKKEDFKIKHNQKIKKY